MLPIHTILYPTDFSDHSVNACRLACALARDYSARLVVLHVFAIPTAIYGEGIIAPTPEEILDEAREGLRTFKIDDAGINSERRIEEGDASTVIMRVAKEVHADLVVIGTHGRTGLSRLLMGSVAERVVRHSSCPVLTVKTPFPEIVTDATALQPVPA